MFPINGSKLTNLIPQKPPFVFIDSLNDVTENKCITNFTFKADNVLCENGKLMLAGLLENMAQSAGCKMGYEDFTENKKSRRGFIGEVKNFSVSRLPNVGEELTTEITIEGKVFGAVTLIAGKTFVGNEEIASCNMKVFFEPEEETA